MLSVPEFVCQSIEETELLEEYKILLYFPQQDIFVTSGIYERYAFDSYYTVDMSEIELSGEVAAIEESMVVEIMEAVLYGTFMRAMSETPRKKGVYIIYALVANVISFVVGFQIAKMMPRIF